ncbi:hypothetical protein LU670_10635 [Pseudomonas monteilii]|nr:hypothetical protein [Pseudomonas monteilii]
MLVPLSPVTRTFEYFTQHLPGQISQEQCANGRHEKSDQVQQYQPRSLQLSQSFCRSPGVRLRRRHGQESRIILDALNMPDGQVDERFVSCSNGAGFQVRLVIQQALAQRLLIIRLPAKCNPTSNRLAEPGIAHGSHQASVSRTPVIVTAQRLNGVVWQIKQHAQQTSGVEDQTGEPAWCSHQLERNGAIHPVPQDLQRTHVELMVRKQLWTLALPDFTQHSQVTTCKLPFDGRNLDCNREFKALVDGQLALETCRQYLIKMVLIGLTDICATAQLHHIVDALRDDTHWLARRSGCIDQRRIGKERLTFLEVLQQLLQGRNGHEIGLERLKLALADLQTPSLFTPVDVGQIHFQLQLRLHRLLEVQSGKPLKRLQLLRGRRHAFLALQMCCHAGPQQRQWFWSGTPQPGGQLLGDKVVGRVQQFRVNRRLGHGQDPQA